MLRIGEGIYKREKSTSILEFEQTNVHLSCTEVRVSMRIECESLARDGEVDGMWTEMQIMNHPWGLEALWNIG